MPIVAVAREMRSLGSVIAQEVLLAVRALAAGGRAILQATPETVRVALDVQAAGGARVKVFRRPVR